MMFLFGSHNYLNRDFVKRIERSFFIPKQESFSSIIQPFSSMTSHMQEAKSHSVKLLFRWPVFVEIYQSGFI